MNKQDLEKSFIVVSCRLGPDLVECELHCLISVGSHLGESGQILLFFTMRKIQIRSKSNQSKITKKELMYHQNP